MPPHPILYAFTDAKIHQWIQEYLHPWRQRLVTACQVAAEPFVQGAILAAWLVWIMTAALMLSF